MVIIHFYFQCARMTMNNISASGCLTTKFFHVSLRWIQKNGNVINSCYYREMPNVLKKNLIIIKSIIVSKWNHFFTKNHFRKKKINFCYGFMPSDFQIICGSMVCKNCWLLASTETPVCDMCTSIHINF